MTDDAVAKCFGCGHWFDLIATESVGTIQEGDVRISQRWCIGCLREIELNTKTIIEASSEYPLGTDPWEESEPDSESGNENQGE